MSRWDNGHMDAGWGIVMMLMFLIVLVGVALVIAWFERSRRAPSAPASGSNRSSAEQILAERLARGEIEPEDYRARLAALSTHH